MQAKVFPAFIETRHGGRCVVSHERSFGRYQKVQNLEHYLEVSIKKQGAFAGSTPLERWRAQGRVARELRQTTGNTQRAARQALRYPRHDPSAHARSRPCLRPSGADRPQPRMGEYDQLLRDWQRSEVVQGAPGRDNRSDRRFRAMPNSCGFQC